MPVLSTSPKALITLEPALAVIFTLLSSPETSIPVDFVFTTLFFTIYIYTCFVICIIFIDNKNSIRMISAAIIICIYN